MRKAKFDCLKCGARHVFKPNGSGFDVELEEKPAERKPRERREPNLFEFLAGQTEEDDQDDEESN